MWACELITANFVQYSKRNPFSQSPVVPVIEEAVACKPFEPVQYAIFEPEILARYIVIECPVLPDYPFVHYLRVSALETGEGIDLGIVELYIVDDRNIG